VPFFAVQLPIIMVQYAVEMQSVSALQVAGQAPPEQRYGEQSWVPPSVHTPTPLQVSALFNVVPDPQDAAVHTVPLAYLRHAPAPSQAPSFMQDMAPLSVHSLSGSIPVTTGPHVPLAPEPFLSALHATQRPTHEVSQQTPSTQLPLVQSVPVPHACPFGLVPRQVEPLQWRPAAQSASVVHIERHAPMLQAYGEQFCVMLSMHRPMPLQVSAFSSVLPPLHDAATQTVPLAYFWQEPAPLHTPVSPQLMEPWSLHSFSGSVFVATLPHTPSAPDPFVAAVQALQIPAHRLSQQTPSTQLPLVH
jgi:hypothetical protein